MWASLKRQTNHIRRWRVQFVLLVIPCTGISAVLRKETPTVNLQIPSCSSDRHGHDLFLPRTASHDLSACGVTLSVGADGICEYLPDTVRGALLLSPSCHIAPQKTRLFSSVSTHGHSRYLLTRKAYQAPLSSPQHTPRHHSAIQTLHNDLE